MYDCVEFDDYPGNIGLNALGFQMSDKSPSSPHARRRLAGKRKPV